MSFCLNPNCQSRQNPDNTEFCECCKFPLLLNQRYRPLNPIGRGGFGYTFLARDEYKPSNPKCVIKQFHGKGFQEAPEKAKELFKREAELQEKLGKHDRIPEVLAHFEQEKFLYLVQEFIEGHNLNDELNKEGVFSELKVWQLLEDLLPLLQFVHQNQVIHRDIKPENIIRRQIDGKLVLVDFGISKLATETALRKTGTGIGTEGYAAPEQKEGKANFISDLYSLGATCYHLLSWADPARLLYRSVDWQKEIRDNLQKRDISDELIDLLTKLLQQDINQRYQSVEEVVKHLALQNRIPNVETNPYEFSFALNLNSNSYRKPSNDAMSASLSIDYTQLEKLLATEKWKDADELTASFTIEMMSKLPINMFFCQDIRTIDRLWGQYSSKRFSFSVQKRIWQSITKIKYTPHETCCRFMEYVGWNKPYSDHQLYFTPDAPEGHLPASVWLLFWRNYQHLGMDKAISKWFELFSCIDSCGL